MEKLLRTCCIFLVITSILSCVAGCFRNAAPYITDLYFAAATGNKEHDNVIRISFNSLSGSGMSSTAEELISEINAISDRMTVGHRKAYTIQMTYIDINNEEHCVEKIGYDSFPSNWETIVDLINELSPKEKVTASRDIVTVDGEYIAHNFSVNDIDMPSGVSLDDVIKEMDISYETLYSGNYNVRTEIQRYVFYNYSVAGAYRMTEIDADPPTSTGEELKEYLDAKADSYYMLDDDQIAVRFTYKDYEYVVIRYDRLQMYIDSFDREVVYEDRGYLHFRYIHDDYMYEMNMYVDSSGRFVILTNFGDENSVEITFLQHLLSPI